MVLWVDFFNKMSLQRLSAEKLPLNLNLLPSSSYIVGGAVRDALLNRQRDYFDLDFVLETDAVETARKVANAYQGGFVLLDAERQIARVVLKEGTVDFAQQEGESLEKDLQRRDFTVNAIAYNPHTLEIIDPLQGCSDLQQGLLKMVSQKNLEDDPLRLLRAYRQAAQLHFTIESNTQSTIRHLADLIHTVAAERVQTELGYLLSHSWGTPWLIAAGEDGLLSPWFPSLTAEKLQTVANVNTAVATLGEELLEKDTNADKMAKLASLVSFDPQQAEFELMELKYSRADIRTVTTALKALPELQQAETASMSLREQYFFFLNVGNVLPCLALLAVATGVNQEVVKPLLQRYLNPDDPVAHPTSLVTGKDIMRSLSIPPSPQIGKLLIEIQIAQIEGKISTPAEAIEYAKSVNSQQ